MSLAVRNLLVERTRFVLSVLGVTVAVLLVLIMSGIFVGTTRQVELVKLLLARAAGAD